MIGTWPVARLCRLLWRFAEEIVASAAVSWREGMQGGERKGSCKAAGAQSDRQTSDYLALQGGKIAEPVTHALASRERCDLACLHEPPCRCACPSVCRPL